MGYQTLLYICTQFRASVQPQRAANRQWLQAPPCKEQDISRLVTGGGGAPAGATMPARTPLPLQLLALQSPTAPGPRQLLLWQVGARAHCDMH